MARVPGSGRFNIGIGQQFKEWTVVGDGYRRNNVLVYPCKCSCGTLRDISSQSLREGKYGSCGCKKSKYQSERLLKHGMSRTPPHNRWMSMIQRCTDPKCKAYPSYGGRGISVCERWMDFQNFYDDMGDPPSENHTLDRIGNDGNCSPESCRWEIGRAHV